MGQAALEVLRHIVFGVAIDKRFREVILYTRYPYPSEGHSAERR